VTVANGRSLLDLAVSRGGIIKGAQAAQHVTQWAIAERDLGRRLGSEDTGSLSAAIRDYAKYWKCSEKTGWREHTRFLAVFPEEASAARLAGVLQQLMDERELARADKSALLTFPLAV
jgi:hypothetical protein